MTGDSNQIPETVKNQSHSSVFAHFSLLLCSFPPQPPVITLQLLKEVLIILGKIKLAK